MLTQNKKCVFVILFGGKSKVAKNTFKVNAFSTKVEGGKQIKSRSGGREEEDPILSVFSFGIIIAPSPPAYILQLMLLSSGLWQFFFYVYFEIIEPRSSTNCVKINHLKTEMYTVHGNWKVNWIV